MSRLVGSNMHSADVRGTSVLRTRRINDPKKRGTNSALDGRPTPRMTGKPLRNVAWRPTFPCLSLSLSPLFVPFLPSFLPLSRYGKAGKFANEGLGARSVRWWRRRRNAFCSSTEPYQSGSHHEILTEKHTHPVSCIISWGKDI